MRHEPDPIQELREIIFSVKFHLEQELAAGVCVIDDAGWQTEREESAVENGSLFPDAFTTDPRMVMDMTALHEDAMGCRRCPLHEQRQNVVFGVGSEQAELVFVGEAPGADEDRVGEPFVGKAGQLLTNIIRAIKLRREDVYILNVLKCRPPKNRDPQPLEIEQCEPFLRRQLECIRPKVICTLGKFAAQTLLKSTDSISRLRGRFHTYQGIPLMPTYHPAFLLRNPAAKREVWEDIQKIQGRLEGR